MFCQYACLLAISYSKAGIAIVLEYLFPIFIMLYVCISTRRFPKEIEIISIILTLSGIFILATHGNYKRRVDMGNISWYIRSVLFNIYIPRSIMEKYGSVKVTGYGMLIGGIALFMLRQTWNNTTLLDKNGIIVIFSIVLIGTVLAFMLYFNVSRRKGYWRCKSEYACQCRTYICNIFCNDLVTYTI
jgi:drug/metabolite transporter (DMT)-like permease